MPEEDVARHRWDGSPSGASEPNKEKLTLIGYPYKKILCPIDFDDNSMAALAHARHLAIDMGATIHLLHVLPI
ncbi:MAG: universal stress protein, partial [Candidatus Binataceae bacterium]